jgi:hydrogenase nickel incorporation protein HypB
MCATCGCGNDGSMEHAEHDHDGGHHDHEDHDHAEPPGHDHPHPPHEHPHPHGARHEHAPPLVARAVRTISIEEDVLAKNDRVAAENRAAFAARGIAAFNFTSSPGSGKTSLLETLIPRLSHRAPVAVIEGDQETTRDADRIRAAGAPVVQINTRTGCHLDAAMIRQATRTLVPPAASLLLIENVGNLVCPALFDLGERAKVVLLSVTEGEDKPLKYPHMFRAADVAVLTKIDLLPYLDFDVGECIANVRRINPALRLFQVSSRDGNGIPALSDWMAAQVAAQA